MKRRKIRKIKILRKKSIWRRLRTKTKIAIMKLNTRKGKKKMRRRKMSIRRMRLTIEKRRGCKERYKDNDSKLK